MTRRNLLASLLALAPFVGTADAEVRPYYRRGLVAPLSAPAKQEADPGDSSGSPPPATGNTVPPASGSAPYLVTLPTELRVRQGRSFSRAPTTDALGDLTWTSVGSAPPDGTAFDASGTLSGTAAGPGTWPGLALRVDDGKGRSGTSGTMTLSVVPSLSVAPLPPFVVGRIGTPFRFPDLVAYNAIGAVTWTVPDAPGWLGVEGVVASGMPTAIRQDPVTVHAYDAGDGSEATGQVIPYIYPALAIDGIEDQTVFVGQNAGLTFFSIGRIGPDAIELLLNDAPAGPALAARCPGMVFDPSSYSFARSTAPCEVDGLRLRLTDQNAGYMPAVSTVSNTFKLSVVLAQASTSQAARYTTTSEFIYAAAGPLKGMNDNNAETSVTIRDGSGPQAEWDYVVAVDCVTFFGSTDRTYPGFGTDIRVETTDVSGNVASVGAGALRAGARTQVSFPTVQATKVRGLGQGGNGKTYEMGEFVAGNMRGGSCVTPGFSS